MLYKRRCSPKTLPSRAAIALVIIALSTTMLLIAITPVALAFRFPQRVASVARISRSRAAFVRSRSSSLQLQVVVNGPSLPRTIHSNSISISASQHYSNFRSASRTTLFHARRSTSVASESSSTTSAASSSPKVEVSPSDHGTFPLTSFTTGAGDGEVEGGNAAMSVDDRLVKKLRQAIGPTATPTPIQAHAIPLLLHGHDVMASSPTGSGKSIMFGLPLLQRLLLSQPQQQPSQGGGRGEIGRAHV